MKKSLPAAIVMTLICYLVFLFFCPLYDSTDSLMAAIIIDGLFSENKLSQFQHPLLCSVIRPLSRFFPASDMFTVTLHIMVAAGIFLVSYFGLQRFMEKPLKSWRLEDYTLVLILLLGVFFLSAGMNIWNCNYTITAGALVFMGLLLLSPLDRSAASCVAGTALIACGFMLRKESGLLFLPFAGLEIIVSLIEAPEHREKTINRYLPCLLVITLLLGSRTLLYSTEPYATASRYNAARTAIMDFPMKSASQVADAINPIDYTAALDWTFADTKIMNVDMLEQIAEVGSQNAYSMSWAGMQSMLSHMKQTLFHTNLYMLILTIITVQILIRNLLFCGAGRKIESLLAVFGAFLILAYFTFRGRAPMRVWEPVLLAANTVLINSASSSKSENRNPGSAAGNTVFLLLIAVTLWFSAGQVMAYAERNKELHTALTARVGADDSEYAETFDSLYIWPNWHGTVPTYFEHTGKLPSQRVIDHNIALGDWTYGQPYYQKYLERIGAENPVQLLVEGKAYVMGNGIEKYLQLHYGKDIRLVETGTVIDGRTAYRVEKDSSNE